MNDNIFSGLKVVDFASFIAGPSAAVILSDFGADVIKVEPPTGDMWRIGHKIPPQPQAQDPYPCHLANRNKRGITLDLKSPSAQPGSRAASQVGRRAHRQHAASRTQAIEARVRRRRAMESASDLCRRHWLRRKRSRRRSSRIRHYVVLGAQWFVVHDPRRRRAADLAGGRQRRQCDRRRPVCRDCDGTLSP